MEDSTNKEKVLKEIRNALIHKNDNPYQNIDLESEVFEVSDEDKVIVFAEELKKVSGAFHYCNDEHEMLSKIKSMAEERKWDSIYTPISAIEEMLSIGQIQVTKELPDPSKSFAGITFCEFLVARLGSVMVSSAVSGGRRGVVYPEIHIVIAYLSQVVDDLQQALDGITKKYENNLPSMISIVTGPSRTADIEKTLVMGAHGPKELHVFLIDDSEAPIS